MVHIPTGDVTDATLLLFCTDYGTDTHGTDILLSAFLTLLLVFFCFFCFQKALSCLCVLFTARLIMTFVC